MVGRGVFLSIYRVTLVEPNARKDTAEALEGTWPSELLLAFLYSPGLESASPGLQAPSTNLSSTPAVITPVSSASSCAQLSASHGDPGHMGSDVPPTK